MYSTHKDNPKFWEAMALKQVRGNSFTVYKPDTHKITIGVFLVTAMSYGLLEEIQQPNIHNYEEMSKKIIAAPNNCKEMQKIKDKSIETL